MMTTRLAIATLVAVGLAMTPFAAQAKKHRHLRHYISATQSDSLGGSESPGLMESLTTPNYGRSGSPVGTVTAPSIGSYNWPSVGVTNAVPTWNNTNPGGRR